jgi:hypothetical protein
VKEQCGSSGIGRQVCVLRQILCLRGTYSYPCLGLVTALLYL